MAQHVTESDFTILQWNCQGMRSKKDELLHLIQTHKTDIVALQETMFYGNYKIDIPGYNIEKTDGHYNRRAHGGVCLYVHQDIPYQRLDISTTIQAVAVRVQLSAAVTICNIYSSRQHQLSTHILNNLYSQLPQPVLFMGDINGYNPLWGSQSTDTRGRAVENFISCNNLNILANQRGFLINRRLAWT